MDHYEELVAAGIRQWGWGFADRIELQVLNAAFKSGDLFIYAPTPFELMNWEAVERLTDSNIVWETDECEVAIITNMHGGFIRFESEDE